ncbi:MAG: hypothetical protein E7Y34_02840, partial [Mycoplasma sp.]|nr:hypothetical protein [Mycoplasma sp.]
MIIKEKNNSNCISGSCGDGIKEQDENINYEEIKKQQDKANKELFKPFVVFGDHSDEVDINFNNFDIRENFREYHFSDKR